MVRSILRNKKIIIFALLTIPAIIIAGFWYWPRQVQPVEFNYVDIKINPVLFYPAINQFSAGAGDSQARVLIAPHHDLASRLIAQIFSRVASDKIKTVYIIGPNHENSGRGKVITAPVVWRTDLGEVSADFALVNFLRQAGLADFDAGRLATEHAVNTLIPFVKNYFPRARVVPIILFHDLDPEVAGRLADFIYQRADDETLVIGSLDFSHYLSSLQAEKNDKITEQAIKDFNYEKIFSLDDDFVDSPVSLVTVLKTAGLLKATRPEFVGHENSASLTNTTGVLSSTSYFTVLFISPLIKGD